MAAALIGRDTWRCGTICVIAGTDITIDGHVLVRWRKASAAAVQRAFTATLSI